MKFQKKILAGELRAGALRVDITDVGDQGYKGFYLKDCEIVDRLEAKISYLESEGQKFVWISLDECSIRTHSAKIVIAKISSGLNIPTDNIMMACVHTHSGHNAAINWDMLADILIKGIRAAAKNVVIVSQIKQTVGIIKNIANRRVDLPENLGSYCVMFNNQCNVDESACRIDATEQIVDFLKKSEGESFIDKNKNQEYVLGDNFDNRVHLWELLDINSKPILAVIRVNAHPVIVSQSRVGAKISGDYAKVLEQLIEKDLNCVCSLFNGAFGDTRPITNNYSFKDREAFAKKYFKALKESQQITSAKAQLTWMQFNDVEVQLRDEMPRSITGIKALRETVLNNIKEKIGSNKINYDLLEVVESFLLHESNRPSVIVYNDEITKGMAVYQINGWAIGPMKILALPGEPLTNFAAAIEKETGVLPIGLANGYLSYLPDIVSAKKGGYEANQNVLNDNGLKELISLSSYFKN